MLAIKATQKDQDDLTRIIRYFVLQYFHQSRLATVSIKTYQFWLPPILGRYKPIDILIDIWLRGHHCSPAAVLHHVKAWSVRGYAWPTCVL